MPLYKCEIFLSVDNKSVSFEKEIEAFCSEHAFNQAQVLFHEKASKLFEDSEEMPAFDSFSHAISIRKL